MKDARLNNGVMMPAIGFGAYQIPADETERIINDAIEVGYRMFDTAASYFNEEQVGNAIRQSGIKRCSDLIISTSTCCTNPTATIMRRGEHVSGFIKKDLSAPSA